MDEVGEAIVGPGNGELVGEVALFLEGVDLILAIVHDFVFLVGVDVLGVEDEILFLSHSLPVHAQYTFGESIAGFLFLPHVDGFLFLVEGLISFECFL